VFGGAIFTGLEDYAGLPAKAFALIVLDEDEKQKTKGISGTCSIDI
jgi:hypothetical protein